MEQVNRPWGKYSVLSKVKIIDVNPNSKLSLQYHTKRSEYWLVLNGNGQVQIEDDFFEAIQGEEYFIRKGLKHRIIAGNKGLSILEVSMGEVDEDDIVRLEDDYNRS